MNNKTISDFRMKYFYDALRVCEKANYYGCDPVKANHFIESLINHYKYVVHCMDEMCGSLGIGDHFSYRYDLWHDLSKFSENEFCGYAEWKWLKDQNIEIPSDVKSNFDHAWLHHQNSNHHHWGYWVIAGRGPLTIPYQYVIEMIADWHGAGREYQGHWDISDWFNNRMRSTLYDESLVTYTTRNNTLMTLSNIGYSVDNSGFIELIKSPF